MGVGVRDGTEPEILLLDLAIHAYLAGVEHHEQGCRSVGFEAPRHMDGDRPITADDKVSATAPPLGYKR
jgi:hypothetical protein